MKVLVACEFSGVVREAFQYLGHHAISIDLEPTERNTGPHIMGDVLKHLDKGWDLMVAFPPCTALTVSGNRYYAGTEERQEALVFVRRLLDAPIAKIALENPVGVISTFIRKPDQIIQPYQFGHPESKKTCLWLKGLPKLEPTNVLTKPERGYWANQTPSGQNKLGPSEDRAKIRSRTYTGIAKAMASQWG